MSLVSMAQKTQTATKCGMDLEQSQKLIHTMLGMSFGCVAFLRGIFADDNFTDQRFIPRKFEKDYNPQDPAMKSDALKVKTLVRGKSAQVDQMLNWLDLGVLDALRKGLLKSLILGIFLDENKPDELHEVYTFSFDYTGGANTIKLEMSQGDTEVVTLLNARQTLQHVMRRLIVVTQGLNPLPEKKFITMRMLFKDSCPKEYQPPGFKDASHDPPAVIKTKKRNFESFTAGEIATGRHDINVKVLTSSTDETNTDDVEMIEIDPFSISKKPKTTNMQPPTLATQPQIPTQEVSQTTKTLRHYLRGDDKPPVLTQAIKEIKCECSCTQELEYTELVRCASCGCFVHAICYGITDKKLTTIPSCYSCRSNVLGGIELHGNLSKLMNLRKFACLLESAYRFGKMSKLYELLGLKAGENDEVISSVMSFGVDLGLIEIQDVSKPAMNVATAGFEIDVGSGFNIGDVVYGKGAYRIVYVTQLKRKSSEKQTTLRGAKKLLFQTTKGKSLCIDEELDFFHVAGDKVVASMESDPINSSDVGEEEDDVMGMNELKIEDQDDGFAFAKTRTRTRNDFTSQESIIDSLPINGFSSNPVITEPRRKLRKTSAAILDSML